VDGGFCYSLICLPERPDDYLAAPVLNLAINEIRPLLQHFSPLAGGLPHLPT